MPALILLDEPNSNLDEAGEQALLAAIAKVREQRRTLILITHTPPLLIGLEKLLVLQNGQLQAFGPTARVLQDLQRAARPTVVPTPSPAPSARRSPTTVSMSYGTPRA